MLIGTATYAAEDLEEIPHSYRNIRGLFDALTDIELSSFAPEHVTLVDDPATPADIMQPLKNAVTEAEDVLLVYYSGHGLLEGEGSDLHLSLTGSESDAPWSSLPFSYLATVIRQAPAATKVVILDCCYSGRAHGDLMSDESQLIKSQLAVEGLYCLTSAPEKRRSKAPEGATYSAFTSHLLATLNEGIAGAGPLLRMSDLYGEVRKRMRATSFPLPEQCNKKDAGAFPLVRNRAYASPVTRPASPELDFSRSRAVVIGCATYEDDRLVQLPSSRNDAVQIHETLLDTDIFGFKPEHCALITDPATPAEFFGPVDDATEEAEDLLLIYYSGHSVVSRSGDLQLLVSTSQLDRSPYTAAPARTLADILGSSRARELVVIADICYGGKLAKAFSSFSGCYILTASGRFQLSMVDGENGLFTGQLLKTLRSGVPGGAPHLNMIDVFREVQRRSGNSQPAPSLSVNGISHVRCLFRNRSEDAELSSQHSCLMTA
ncbi:caspase family protein [Streptomyces sp. NPDC051452]|uniref:caspase, EACC1-associated type n=1 Tax=Streptomyces sp. NPDC051452 TaxID=3365654 RepID=UPI0037B56018